MKLTQKQACLLVAILQDTLSRNVVGYLKMKHEDRIKLLNEILNQQDTKLMDVEDISDESVSKLEAIRELVNDTHMMDTSELGDGVRKILEVK